MLQQVLVPFFQRYEILAIGAHDITSCTVLPQQGVIKRTFAMDGDGALGVFTDLEKALQDAVTGHGAVDEEHVVVVEAGVGEAPGVVDLLVETDDGRDAVFAEVREVCFRCV